MKPPEREDIKLAGISDALHEAKSLKELDNIVEYVIKPITKGLSAEGLAWLRLEYLSVSNALKEGKNEGGSNC